MLKKLGKPESRKGKTEIRNPKSEGEIQEWMPVGRNAVEPNERARGTGRGGETPVLPASPPSRPSRDTAQPRFRNLESRKAGRGQSARLTG
jgi:hypothetical protein